MAASHAISSSFPLFTAGAMVYGAARAYNHFQDKSSSQNTYLGIAVGVSAVQKSWAFFLPAAASPNVAGVGVGLLTLAGATLYQGGMMYAAMKAGEQVGIAAQSSQQQHTNATENRELR